MSGFFDRLQVVPDGVELIGGVALECRIGRFAAGGVLGHFGAGGDAAGVVHPAVIPFATQALGRMFEVEALHFKSGGGLDRAEAVAGGASEAFVRRDEVLADGDESGIAGMGGFFLGINAVESGEAFAERGGVGAVGGHAHVEPRAGLGNEISGDDGLGEGTLQHLADEGHVRAGLVEFFVRSGDVRGERLGFGMGAVEQGGQAIARVAGIAAQRVEFPFGGFGLIVNPERAGAGGVKGKEGESVVFGEVEGRGGATFFCRSDAALGVPVGSENFLQAGHRECLRSGQTGVAVKTMVRGGDFLAARGITGESGLGGEGSLGLGGEEGAETADFLIAELEVRHAAVRGVGIGSFEEGSERTGLELRGDVAQRDAFVFQVGLFLLWSGVAGRAAEFVEMRTTSEDGGFIGGRRFRVGSRFHRTEKSREVSDLLGAFRFFRVEQLRHRGARAQGVRFAEPGAQPGFLQAVAGVDEERGDFLQFRHRVRAQR